MVLAMGGHFMSQFVVGVTGGIGSGKTTVTDAFKALGIDIVDADVIAREVVEPGSDALAKIHQHFGDSVLHDDGQLNRGWLRETVFSDPQAKTWLNQLLHPRIRAAIEAKLQQAQSAYAILSAPLLLENDLTYLTDRVLVVDVQEATQLERTMARDNNSRAQVEAIMQAQWPRQQRCQAADDIVNNDGTLEDVYDQVQSLHRTYLDLAAATHSTPKA